jgi:hypothetical protein
MPDRETQEAAGRFMASQSLFGARIRKRLGTPQVGSGIIDSLYYVMRYMGEVVVGIGVAIKRPFTSATVFRWPNGKKQTKAISLRYSYFLLAAGNLVDVCICSFLIFVYNVSICKRFHSFY